MPLWSDKREKLGPGNDPVTIYFSDNEAESLIEFEESKPKPTFDKAQALHFLVGNKVYDCEINITTDNKITVNIDGKEYFSASFNSEIEDPFPSTGFFGFAISPSGDEKVIENLKFTPSSKSL